jgi:hypothetical protein
MRLSRRLRTMCVLSSALFLSPLLTSCASHTETIVKTEFMLPPAGLVVPCNKPAVIGTWPEVVAEDIPRLKAALGECATQADEYLKWRTSKDKPG